MAPAFIAAPAFGPRQATALLPSALPRRRSHVLVATPIIRAHIPLFNSSSPTSLPQSDWTPLSPLHESASLEDAGSDDSGAPSYDGYEDPVYGAPPAGGSTSDAANSKAPAAGSPSYDGWEAPKYDSPSQGATNASSQSRESASPSSTYKYASSSADASGAAAAGVPSYGGWEEPAYGTPSAAGSADIKTPGGNAPVSPSHDGAASTPSYGGWEEPAYGTPSGESSTIGVPGGYQASVPPSYESVNVKGDSSAPSYDGWQDPVYGTVPAGGSTSPAASSAAPAAGTPSYGGWKEPAYGGVPPSGGGGGASWRNGGDGGDASGGREEEDDALSSVLARQNASTADVPADILAAYRNGYVGLDAVANFFSANKNFLSRFMMGWGPGMRNRFLADKLFLLKILIEEGIGVFGKLSAEYEQRRGDFWKEGEFVFANLITAILADFALVYLPAPSVALKRVTGQKGFGAWLSNLSTSLPSNIFQTDRPFTLGQRAGGFALKASQLFVVGTLCCFTGVLLTNALVFVRERADKDYKPKTQKQNPLAVSLLYATFLGLSSGSRYQLVNGVENHIFPRVFKSTPDLVEKVATFVLRYVNTFWGSQQWVMFCRYTKVQKVKSQ